MFGSLTARLVVVTAMTASLVAVSHPAQAHHRANFYCSASGDLCESARKVDGARTLGVLLAARYFRVFHLCVTDPDGYEACVPFHVRSHDDGTFGRDVKWRKYFPYGDNGAYTVRWVANEHRIGKVLGFHVR